MANKMLIDASHPEETRVVVVRGNRVEEFDFESANKKQLRGNIYLAKVIRVEPSLQAAFVDYGGNRHGFLAFSEIHPDYYQIPVADRQALIEEEARHERESDESEDNGRRNRRRGKGKAARRNGGQQGDAVVSEDAPVAEADAEGLAAAEAEHENDHEQHQEHESESASDSEPVDPSAATEEPPVRSESDDEDEAHEEPEHAEEHADENGEPRHVIEQVGAGDALEEVPERPRAPRRQYKIQEVIKRRQVLLVQVVKEERGNKGAALTTYLSLAGRYSVLMPNTGRGGGISRKITDAVDRKRLKAVAQELDVPEGMGVILRTAGASRTKTEIKRDFEYLMRLWETVRELTLQSSAPALVYEEGSLVKRAIRDLYNKDIDEVLVSGEAAYKDAKDFMRMLMPSHAKNVKPYRDVQPLFARFGVEAQLDAMFSNQVTLKSGGYIVINQTEALVAIDVNSGRATREHNIEDTALKTNCEAADEVARQLRLRDLAGLIVIDFIDMEENRNNRTVERRLKEALKNDRARIQVGRISPFGLMEMSRQRIRTGVLEGSTVPCPHCAGAGIVRATPSIALHVLRAVEEMLIKSNSHHLIVRTRTDVCLYILNQKRSHLRGLEDRFGVDITILADDAHHTGVHAFAIERGEQILNPRPIVMAPVHVDSVAMPEEDEIEDQAVEETDEEEEEEEVEAREPRAPRQDRGRQEAREPRAESENGEGGRRRRRRRRRRGGRGGEGRPEAYGSDAAPMPVDAPQPDVTGAPFAGTHTFEPETVADDATTEGLALNEAEAGLTVPAAEEEANGRRRRGRRGGRRLRGERAEESEVASGAEDESLTLASEAAVEAQETAREVEEAPAKPARKPRAPRRTKAAAAAAAETSAAEAPMEASQPEPAPAAPAPVAAPAPAPEPVAAAPAQEPEPQPEPAAEPITTEPVVIGAEPATPRKVGWWAKAKSALGG
ncbi:ribonuclease E/G [Alsobacter soli]|uniref:Ribonuclease E n=1 Tax=Alsobacter soli TaxID=2109933 RepID=A0A2T1HVW2_9HYPH|nr:ribonuclease E/G [Alsobacter soli]PSC05793.1 ribonuclease E/G [Alsobacter soli]